MEEHALALNWLSTKQCDEKTENEVSEELSENE